MTETTCCICLEELNEVVTTTSCQHTFHTSCLEDWLRHGYTCPLCRVELAPRQIDDTLPFYFDNDELAFFVPSLYISNTTFVDYLQSLPNLIYDNIFSIIITYTPDEIQLLEREEQQRQIEQALSQLENRLPSTIGNRRVRNEDLGLPPVQRPRNIQQLPPPRRFSGQGR